jgi:hypothetical protein
MWRGGRGRGEEDEGREGLTGAATACRPRRVSSPELRLLSLDGRDEAVRRTSFRAFPSSLDRNFFRPSYTRVGWTRNWRKFPSLNSMTTQTCELRLENSNSVPELQLYASKHSVRSIPLILTCNVINVWISTWMPEITHVVLYTLIFCCCC